MKYQKENVKKKNSFKIVSKEIPWWLGLHACQGTKIPQATWCSQKKKCQKKTKNKPNQGGERPIC